MRAPKRRAYWPRMGTRPMEVLQQLAEARGELVSAQDLLEATGQRVAAHVVTYIRLLIAHKIVERQGQRRDVAYRITPWALEVFEAGGPPEPAPRVRPRQPAPPPKLKQPAKPAKAKPRLPVVPVGAISSVFDLGRR